MMRRMRTSKSGLDLIKNFEGFRARAAQLPDGRWSIGYAHTHSARENLRITRADAEAVLREYDLPPVERSVGAAVLAPLLDRSAEFCVGSRIAGGGAQVLPPQARFGTRLAVVLMRLLFGARWTDLGPQRAIRRESLEGLAMRDTDYGWTVEMQLKAHAAKLRSVEVPGRYRERVGESKISGTLRGTLGAGWKILGWIGVWRIRLLLPWRG